MAIDPVLAASVRAYVARDWGRFERERDRDFEAARRRGGLAVALRTMDQLRANARLWQPAWPEDDAREADLAHHQALIGKLDRIAAALTPDTRARPRPGRSRRR
ncbi:MAG: hypothetical protein JNK64_16585 [Myxococcales bacterium]|nr:hypothetical protein [Myxococcales bacterium]